MDQVGNDHREMLELQSGGVEEVESGKSDLTMMPEDEKWNPPFFFEKKKTAIRCTLILGLSLEPHARECCVCKMAKRALVGVMCSPPVGHIGIAIVRVRNPTTK